jgi:hypothetical protein
LRTCSKEIAGKYTWQHYGHFSQFARFFLW